MGWLGYLELYTLCKTFWLMFLLVGGDWFMELGTIKLVDCVLVSVVWEIGWTIATRTYKVLVGQGKHVAVKALLGR